MNVEIANTVGHNQYRGRKNHEAHNHYHKQDDTGMPLYNISTTDNNTERQQSMF